MKPNFLKIFFFSFVITALVVPILTTAAIDSTDTITGNVAVNKDPGKDPGKGTGTGTGKDVKIDNPIKYNTFEGLIKAISNFLFNVALAVAPIMIIIAGFYFVTSAGDPAKLTIAKNIILYTLIGLLIILLSKGLISLLETTLQVKK